MGMVRALKDLGIMKALVMKVDMGMVMEMEAVAASENFFKAFLKKHKLHNLIKKNYIMTTTTTTITIKKHVNT